MNEEENPWKPLDTGKLISPPKTSNTESQTPKGEELEDLLKNYSPSERPLKDLYERTSNLIFGPNREEDPFSRPLSERIPILSTFPTWELTDDTYYYNLLRNKGSGKRKFTFGRTITIPPSNLLSGKQLRYQTRYQTRSNNSPEESPDNDDDDDDDDNNNPPPNRQPNQPPPPPPPPPRNQNMNDGNGGGNNPPDGGQNNIMAQALTALAAALENLQLASAQAPRKQNIAQVPKFHGYGNEDPAKWAKRFDAACLTNNWRLNRQKDIAESFLDRPAFQWFDENYNRFGQWYTNGANNNLRDLLIAKYTTIAMRNKWQIEYRNIH